MFGPEISSIKSRLSALEQHCKEAVVSDQVLFWENVITTNGND